MKKLYGTLKCGNTIHKLENKSTLIGRAPTSHIVIQVYFRKEIFK